ncbi:MAG TPA: hypothetical protein VJ715_00505, partial [Pyrinomonadaceae bacterium]|nr:hypothetical protein [Pyrinomonadaceae bacterium]
VEEKDKVPDSELCEHVLHLLRRAGFVFAFCVSRTPLPGAQVASPAPPFKRRAAERLRMTEIPPD